MLINILVPLAGNRAFKMGEGNAFPKILTEVNGKLLLERAASPLLSLEFEKNFVAVVPKQHVKQYSLDKVLSSLDSSIKLIQIDGETEGATCTALMAIDELRREQPLIISSFEQVLDFHLTPFIQELVSQDADCGVLTFDSIHPRFSYVLVDEESNVLQAAEKKPISRNAIAGLYYFKRASDFIDAAKNSILNTTADSGYYISNTINEVVLKGLKVKALPIEKERYFHFYDAHNLEQYETSIGTHEINRSLLAETKRYAKAFSDKNIEKVSTFFSTNFELTDPSVCKKGKEDVVKYISEIFNNCKSLRFEDKNIFVDGKVSVIEFELVIDGLTLIGTDIISWDNMNKMLTMNAYLYEVKNEN